MSKRNISYIKPAEPSFLRKIKEQIGYKEGPTVDTKVGQVEISYNLSIECALCKRCYFNFKKQLSAYEEEDDSIDEQPTVVVLKPGDLTAEEAAKEKTRIEKGTK